MQYKSMLKIKHAISALHNEEDLVINFQLMILSNSQNIHSREAQM